MLFKNIKKAREERLARKAENEQKKSEILKKMDSLDIYSEEDKKILLQLNRELKEIEAIINNPKLTKRQEQDTWTNNSYLANLEEMYKPKNFHMWQAHVASSFYGFWYDGDLTYKDTIFYGTSLYMGTNEHIPYGYTDNWMSPKYGPLNRFLPFPDNIEISVAVPDESDKPKTYNVYNWNDSGRLKNVTIGSSLYRDFFKIYKDPVNAEIKDDFERFLRNIAFMDALEASLMYSANCKIRSGGMREPSEFIPTPKEKYDHRDGTLIPPCFAHNIYRWYRYFKRDDMAEAFKKAIFDMYETVSTEIRDAIKDMSIEELFEAGKVFAVNSDENELKFLEMLGVEVHDDLLENIYKKFELPDFFCKNTMIERISDTNDVFKGVSLEFSPPYFELLGPKGWRYGLPSDTKAIPGFYHGIDYVMDAQKEFQQIAEKYRPYFENVKVPD